MRESIPASAADLKFKFNDVAVSVDADGMAWRQRHAGCVCACAWMERHTGQATLPCLHAVIDA